MEQFFDALICSSEFQGGTIVFSSPYRFDWKDDFSEKNDYTVKNALSFPASTLSNVASNYDNFVINGGHSIAHGKQLDKDGQLGKFFSVMRSGGVLPDVVLEHPPQHFGTANGDYINFASQNPPQATPPCSCNVDWKQSTAFNQNHNFKIITDSFGLKTSTMYEEMLINCDRHLKPTGADCTHFETAPSVWEPAICEFSNALEAVDAIR